MAEQSPFAFSQIANMGDADSGYGQQLQGALAPPSSQLGPTPRRIPGEEELQNALAGMRDFQARLSVGAAASAVPSPPDEISMKTDPKTGQRTVNVKTSAENYEATTRSAMNWHEALGGMQQELAQMDSRLKAREEQIRNQPPWVQLATALSANLAQAKDMPGWVQGLGRTAAQLNPQADQIRAERMQVLGQEAQLAERAAATEMRAGQMAEGRAQREAAGITDAEKQRRLLVEKARDNLAQSIGKGTGTMDTEAATSMLTEAGATAKESAAILKDLGNLATNVKTAYEAARSDKAESQRLAREEETRRQTQTNATIKALATKNSDKSDVDKAIETTAQDLAAGGMSSIKDISSFRQGERIKIFARALEINPKFSTSETNRKIDMEKSFTVGKDGQGLQSFGTFLQHAGEVKDVLDGMYQGGSPALNKPMNWLRKNAAGNPEYQRLLVSLEPVGKEFESFLLNQRALYVDDRRQIETMLNGNSSPAQIRSALNQMGKTAKDRYTEMNHRYKRVMKHDLEVPFGEEAIAGATKIGVDLSRAAPAQTTKDPLGIR